ncbi:hypothetical protein ACEWY4_010789 [Coilia grayii]|uniref:Uncharacterized protein n=1 Tax=Coilia grayii TaxID=363190 RepID=A0ABD1K2Y6_9TELE
MALLPETLRILFEAHVFQQRARLDAKMEEMRSLILAEVEWKLSSFRKTLIDQETRAGPELSGPGYTSWTMSPEDGARLKRWEREEEEVRERRIQLRSEGIQPCSPQKVEMRSYETEARVKEQEIRMKALAEELKTIEKERRKMEELKREMKEKQQVERKRALEEEWKNIEREKQKIEEERKEMERQAKIQEKRLREKKRLEMEAKQQEDAVRKKALEEQRQREKIDLEWKRIEAEQKLMETEKQQLLERVRKLEEEAVAEKKAVTADTNRVKEEWEKVKKEKRRMEKERWELRRKEEGLQRAVEKEMRGYEALMKEMKKDKQNLERDRKGMAEEKILRGGKSDEVKPEVKITEMVVEDSEAGEVARGNGERAESSDEFSSWDSDESDQDDLWKPEAKSNTAKKELPEATVSAETGDEDSPWDSDEEQAIPTGTKTSAMAPNTQRANSPQEPADVCSVPSQNSAATKQNKALGDADLFEEELKEIEKQQEAIPSNSKPVVALNIQKATTPSRALSDAELFDKELEELEKELEVNTSNKKPLVAPNNQKVTSIPNKRMTTGDVQKETTLMKQDNVCSMPIKKNTCVKTQSDVLTDPWSDEDLEECDYKPNTQTQKKKTIPAKKEEEEDTDTIVRELERLNEELKKPKVLTAPKKLDQPLANNYTSTASTYGQNDTKACVEWRARERQNDSTPRSATGRSPTGLKAGSNLAGLKGSGTQGQKASSIEGPKSPVYLKYLDRFNNR